MLVSKKEKRKTKEQMKRNAEHSIILKKRELENKELRKKKTKGKKEKKRTRRKKTKKQKKTLVDPASSHMLVSKKEKRKTKVNNLVDPVVIRLSQRGEKGG